VDYTFEQLRAAFDAGCYVSENLPLADKTEYFDQFCRNIKAGGKLSDAIEPLPALDVDKPRLVTLDDESTSSTTII
jgi:hypothetical protein